MNTRIVPILVLALAAACHEGPTAVANQRVRAVKEAGGIRLTNLSDRASAYFIVDRNTLALIDWLACVSEAPDCLRLPARGNVLVPFDQIAVGGVASKEVVIYTWWVLPDIEGVLHADMDDPLLLRL